MRNYLLTSLIIILIGFNVQAQKRKIKFGKVSKDELLMTHYEKDSSANAVILSDIGELYYTYNNSASEGNRGFEYVFKRHLRIKIFNKDAYKFANQEINLRHYKTKAETISKFKAYTFNLENGKIENSKISKNDLMIENYNDYLNVSKYNMPNVNEGSIIDIEYTIQSNYLYYLRNWQFQYEIPVVYSEYKVSIPEYFKYNHFFDGIQKLLVNEKSAQIESYTIQWVKSNRPGLPGWQDSNSTKTQRFTEEIPINCKKLKFAAKEVEAFEEEPYMASTDNFLFKVYFELEQIKYPYAPLKSYAKSWETMNKDLQEDRRFGERFRLAVLPKDLVPEITKGCTTEEEKINKIYSYVRSNIVWNNRLNIYAESPLRSVLKDKVGSSAEINLLLVKMLRIAEIDAQPVIISTRANGMVNKYQPGISQFNSVIAYALVNQKNILLDGTGSYCSSNFLPKRCLNGEGRIVGENFSDWINLNPDFFSKEVIGGNFKIDVDLNLIGKTKTTKNNYYAYDFRNKLDNYESNDNYMEEYQNEMHTVEVLDYNIENKDELNLPVKINCSIKISETFDQVGDLLMFKPLNIYSELKNPFKSEERKYPVNFTYPTEQLYVMNYQIPEGYQLEELPKSIQVVTPDKTASFSYSIVSSGSIINVKCKKVFSKTFYLPSEYKALKLFYDQIIAKQTENIVLKKTI